MNEFERIMNSTPIHEDNKKIILLTPNMTLRDYFAGQALAGLLAHGRAFAEAEGYATLAYKYGDVMLAEREKK